MYDSKLLGIDALVKHFESFSPHPYRDQVGVLTIGYGLTGPAVTADTGINAFMATMLLEYRLLRDQEELDSARTGHFSTYALNAFVSLAYNVGLNAVLSYKSWSLLNQGLWLESIPEFWDANKAGGKFSAGLARRRQAELVYWLYQGLLETDPSRQRKLLLPYADKLLLSGDRSEVVNNFCNHIKGVS